MLAQYLSDDVVARDVPGLVHLKAASKAALESGRLDVPGRLFVPGLAKPVTGRPSLASGFTPVLGAFYSYTYAQYKIKT